MTTVDSSIAQGSGESRTPHDAQSLRNFIEVTSGALRPERDVVALTANTIDGTQAVDVNRLWLCDGESGRVDNVCGDGVTEAHTMPSWSADGRFVSFLSVNAEEMRSVRVVDVSTMVVHQVWPPEDFAALTALPHLAGSFAAPVAPRWDCQGRLAFAVVSDCAAANEPVLVDTDLWQFDGLGLAVQNRSVVVVAEPQQDGRWSFVAPQMEPSVALSVAWSPSGRQVMRLGYDPQLTAHFVLEIHDLDSGEHLVAARWPRLVYPPVACWVSDDDIAMTTAWNVNTPVDLQVWTRGHSDLRLVPVRGQGQVVGHIEAAVNRDLAEPRLLHDGGRGVLLTVQARGTQRIVRVNIDTGELDEAIATQAVVRGIERVGKRVLVAATDFSTPTTLHIVDLPPVGQTAGPADFTAVPRPGARMTGVPATVHERSFQTSTGGAVDTWLLTPSGASGPLPTVLRLHGGPFVGNGAAFSFDDHLLLAQGYAVMLVNFRGSSGYGQDFAAAIEDGWGPIQQQDVTNAVLGWEAEGLVDGARLASWGSSGGGYLTLWLMTRTGLLKAGIAEVPVVDWGAMYASDIPQLVQRWVKEVPGAGVESALALAADSPLSAAQNLRGDLLLIAHLEDRRCPPTQVELMYNVLRARGHKVRMLRLPHLPHSAFGVNHLEVKVARLTYALDHFRHHLG